MCIIKYEISKRLRKVIKRLTAVLYNNSLHFQNNEKSRSCKKGLLLFIFFIFFFWRFQDRKNVNSLINKKLARTRPIAKFFLGVQVYIQDKTKDIHSFMVNPH